MSNNFSLFKTYFSFITKSWNYFQEFHGQNNYAKTFWQKYWTQFITRSFMWGQLLLLVPCTLGACSYWLWVEVGVGGVGTSGDHSVHGWWWLWGIVPKYQAHFYPVNLDTRTFAFETGRTGAVVESPDMFLSPDWSSQTWPWSNVTCSLSMISC